MSERFDSGLMLRTPDDAVRFQSIFKEIADTGAVDSLNTVRHDLGRVPRGYRIIKAWFASTPAGAIVPYKLLADSNDTETTLYVRFTQANARVALEIF